ncbi:MAG: HEAT repeat domain-containing protein [Promethearchaeota archaeon]
MADIDTWLQRLKDDDPKGREEALYALGELGDERAVESLIAMLEDSSSNVRKGAAVALGWLKDTRAVDPLLKYLKKAKANEFSSITYALSELKDMKAVEPLIQMALEAKSQQMRKPCIRALGKLNDKRAIIPFIEILSNEKEARDFLAFTRETLDRMLDDEGIKELIRAFDYPYESVKWFTSKKLSELSEKSFEPLVHAIKEGNREIRKFSIITIAEMNDSNNIDFLNQFIDDTELRHYAAIAFGKRGDTQIKDILLEGLNHHSEWIRKHSALALSVIKNKDAINALISALKDSDREVRAAAAFALGELRDESAIDPLIQTMADEKSESYYTKGAIVRETIAEALGKIGVKATERLLEIAEGDMEWNLRFFAIIALAEIGNEKGIELLIHGMNDQFFLIRYASSKILRRMIAEKKIPLEKVKKAVWSFLEPHHFRKTLDIL